MPTFSMSNGIKVTGTKQGKTKYCQYAVKKERTAEIHAWQVRLCVSVLIKEYLLYMLLHSASGWMLFRGRRARQDK